MGVSSPGVKTAERTHVYDSALCDAEMRQSFARDEEWAAGVRFEDSIPLVEGQAFESRGGEDGGVVDEDVEVAKCGGDLSNGGTDGSFGANVAGDSERFAAKSGDGAGSCCGVGFRRAI